MNQKTIGTGAAGNCAFIKTKENGEVKVTRLSNQKNFWNVCGKTLKLGFQAVPQ
ncbi:MAG: hypothetical protein ACSLE0_16330 [Chitinophagaceae bacterium]